jgi:DNA helicase II / ATP-dependent DNA helicase PcrA
LLNEAQHNAVNTTEGPLLIIAGPGSGKTHTLIGRIYYLIKERKVAPKELFVATFTEKAAKELQTRVSNKLSSEGIVFNLNEMYLGTLHSICLDILGEFRKYTRLKKSYRVMDQFDQQYMIYQNIKLFLEIYGIHLLTSTQSNWRKAVEITKWINKVSEELLSLETLVQAQDEEIKVLGECCQIYKQLCGRENVLEPYKRN